MNHGAFIGSAANLLPPKDIEFKLDQIYVRSHAVIKRNWAVKAAVVRLFVCAKVGSLYVDFEVKRLACSNSKVIPCVVRFEF